MPAPMPSHSWEPRGEKPGAPAPPAPARGWPGGGGGADGAKEGSGGRPLDNGGRIPNILGLSLPPSSAPAPDSTPTPPAAPGVLAPAAAAGRL
eukprot:CAMPEP_0181382024 /NCGR_PEP_ID=MMETSP1106-20121128/20477_1 /TAXON_ID=81844 /ORGANISM="Mantoniella antarctica, Strain SL-175" /LENGTH=92 /DNA_ID=CAMNT_0023501333 /DNA_START=43 /DNA_END=321 /DNA_ORIENTATION=+